MLESNPRSMKRLLNAYGLYQAALFLEGRLSIWEALKDLKAFRQALLSGR